MLDKDLVRHGAEFKRHIDRHQYEMTASGVYFPKAKAHAVGEYSYFTNDGENPETADNVLPIEGLNYMLMASLADAARFTQFYVALFGNAYTPTDALTAATFAGTAGEITSNSNGYSEAYRPAWQAGAAAGGMRDSYDNRAAFTITTTSPGAGLVIRGAAVLSSPTKGGTDGVLISCARLPNDRTEYAGNVFNMGYRVRLVPGAP